MAAPGDTVLVGPGTYYEDIDFLGKDVVLKSVLGPEATILDGTGQDSSIVIFKSGETRAAILEGFTITNGQGTAFHGNQREGGGIFCPLSSPTIAHNVLIENHAVWGGALFLGDQVSTEGPFPAPLLEENTFASNTADFGGGAVFSSRSNADLKGNIFKGNEVLTEGDGGGVHLRLTFGSTAIVDGNTFVENIAGDQGGGIFVYTDDQSGPVRIEGNLIARNTARGIGPAVLLVGAGGGLATNRLNGVVLHNTIANNVALPEGLCTGGGIRVAYSSPGLEISYNIIAGNRDCGLVCRMGGDGSLGPNILWNNTVNDIDLSNCPGNWGLAAIIADPLFCYPGTDDYRVAGNSPALAGTEYFGAFPEPGCGLVAVRAITWGRLKALYSEPE